MEQIDEMVIKLPEQFLDITARGICEEELTLEEKKVYLNIVKNHKEEFRKLFIDNYLYKKIFNILMTIFGSIDILLFMTRYRNFFMIIIFIVHIIVVEKGSRDVVEAKSYKDLNMYIEYLEQEIIDEINENLTLKKEEQYGY